MRPRTQTCAPGMRKVERLESALAAAEKWAPSAKAPLPERIQSSSTSASKVRSLSSLNDVSLGQRGEQGGEGGDGGDRFQMRTPSLPYRMLCMRSVYMYHNM